MKQEVSKPVHVWKSLGRKRLYKLILRGSTYMLSSMYTFLIVLPAADKSQLMEGQGLVGWLPVAPRCPLLGVLLGSLIPAGGRYQGRCW